MPRRFPGVSSGKGGIKLDKQQKAQAVEALKDRLTRAKGLVLTGYKGMTVGEITELREALRKDELEYKVVKNTLARIATEGTPAEPAKEHITGPIGMALGYTDAAQVAKSTIEFAKKNDKFKVLGGVIEGAYCDAAAIKKIADLPSREVLLSMMAGTFNAPATKLAGLLNATVARLGYALSSLKDQKAAAGE
ncbi:MAG: 50S ribosomal protein L10 [Thermodesulfovibrionales bacterium]|nr:50S ribosomal protein L10 [Thermodesulfovibrionales bacterium]